MRELLEEYVPRVYRFALRLSGDPHAAEDLTQETLLRAWRRLDRLREPEAIRTWLFRIAVNLWRDQLRRSRSPVARAEPVDDNQAARSAAPETFVTLKDEAEWALRMLDTLPQRQRDVLHLNACEGLSISDIAEVLSISADAVKASLSLARKRMRSKLRDLLEQPTNAGRGTSLP